MTLLREDSIDIDTAIAVYARDCSYITDTTQLGDFLVTPGAFLQSYGGGNNGFLAKLSASGAALSYSTYLGGNNSDGISKITIDAADHVYAVGYTNSPDFTTIFGAFYTTLKGNNDMFVTKFSPDVFQTTRSGVSDAFVYRTRFVMYAKASVAITKL